MTTLAERAKGTAFAILYAQPSAPEPIHAEVVSKTEITAKEKEKLRGRARRSKAKVAPLEKVRRQVERDNKQRSNWTLT
jgi:hypothetical protein